MIVCVNDNIYINFHVTAVCDELSSCDSHHHCDWLLSVYYNATEQIIFQ